MLTVTEMLRERGVVGKFVEFYGAGLANLPLADRATIGNMSPEFGSTCAIFPIDAETLRYLEFSGRPPEQIELVEAYAKEQGLWHDEDSEEPTFTDTIELDLVDRGAEHRRPQAPPGPRLADRVQGRVPDGAGRPAARRRRQRRGRVADESFPARDPGRPTARRNGDGHEPARAAPAGRRSPTAAARRAPVTLADGTETELDHGHVVIAAITSCTNTSNPSVMLGAGILARNAVQKGLKVKPWVKTSLAPGSKVVTEYLDRAGLTEYLDELGFNLVGYGCTTCIGNSGPLPEEISDVVNAEDLAVVSVLSGNRNFEGRINPDVKMNYLASPPLCVAYALAGTMDIDLYDEPLGEDKDGEPVSSRTSGPSSQRGRPDDRGGRPVGHVPQELRRGVRRRRALELARGARPATRFAWDERSTYVRRPPFFEDLPARARAARGHRGRARAGRARRQRHHRPHLPRRLDQARRPGRRST